MFTPWIVVNLALAGSIAKNWGKQTAQNEILTIILICITGLMAIAKIVMFALYKTKLKHRLHRSNRVQTIEMQSKTKTDDSI